MRPKHLAFTVIITLAAATHLAAHPRVGRSLSPNPQKQEAAQVKSDLDPRAGEAYALGRKHYDSKRFDLAIEQFQRALNFAPNFLLAREWLGFAYLFTNKYEEAIDTYNKLIELKPDYENAYGNLGFVYVQLGKYEQAVEVSRKSIAINPGYAPAYENLGAAYAALEKFDEAAETLTQALRLRPDFMTYANLAGVYYRLRRFEEAVVVGREALRLKPDDAPSYYHLGLAYRQLKRQLEAVDAFNAAIKADPKYDSPYRELGDLYLDLQEYGKAEDLYRRGIKVNPNIFEFHIGLGHTLAKQNKEDEGLAALQEGIRADPVGANRFYKKLAKTDPEKWLETFKRGSETGPEAMESYNDFGVVLLLLKRYEEAIQVFDRILLLDPKNGSAMNNLGKAYSEQGNLDRAIEYLTRATQVKPAPLPLANLASVYLKARQYGEAVKACQQALNLKPDYAKAHYTLGLVYLAMGDRQNAIRQHRDLLNLDPAMAQELYKSISK